MGDNAKRHVRASPKTSTPKTGTYCCVPQCKRHGKMEGIRMLTFPRKFEEKAKWVTRINRENWKPKYGSRICSWHFPDGNRKTGPTRFEKNKDKLFDLIYPHPPPRRTLKKVGRQLPKEEEPMEINGLEVPDQCQRTECTDMAVKYRTIQPEIENLRLELQRLKEENLELLKSQEKLIELKDKLEEEVTRIQNKLSEEVTKVKNNLGEEIAKLKTQLSSLEKENCEQLAVVRALRQLALRYDVVRTRKNFDRLTGISIETFDTLCQIIATKPVKYEHGWKVKSLKLHDQVLVFMVKVRHNISFELMGILFGRARKTISNIFYTFLYSFYYCFYEGLMNEIPSLAKVQQDMPKAFSDFKNCRMVIDCTEFLIECPTKLLHRCSTYSNYKSRNTFKALIGVAPNGSTTFVSDLYGGSTSDKAIVKSSDLFKHFKVGEMIMADKGFLLHDIMPLSLVTPDFLVNRQFTKEQVNRNKKVSAARVHVERTIQRIRVFKIVNVIPTNLRKHASVVIKVASFLSNCMPPIMMENIGKPKKKKKNKLALELISY